LPTVNHKLRQNTNEFEFAMRGNGMGRRSGLTRACVALLVAVAVRTAHADPVADFYRDKTIQIYVGYGAGGGYDAYARLIARHLGRHIPGQPAVVVQNMPGAGSLRAANYIFNRAPKDGTAVATFGRNMIMLGLLGGNSSAQFDPRQFTWLGSPSSGQDDAYVLWVRKDARVKSLAEARVPGGPPLLLGGTADGSTETDIALLMQRTAGVNVRIVAGYPDSNSINLAIERGEVEGRFIGISAIAATQPAWLEPGSFIQPFLQFGRATRHPRFPDIPTAREIAHDERGRQLIELAEIPYMLSRPYVGPPNLPPDRAKALQAALAEVCRDPEFLADAARMRVDVSPVGPQEALRMLERLAEAPPDLKEEIRKLETGGK
jgi:tripartite-type tricarboxylate transporter receptor subunit TctC